MIFPPTFLNQVRRGVLAMVHRHPYMLDWPPQHVTEFYIGIWMMDFKPSVN